jgi:hypothetical protein
MDLTLPLVAVATFPLEEGDKNPASLFEGGATQWRRESFNEVVGKASFLIIIPYYYTISC